MEMMAIRKSRKGMLRLIYRGLRYLICVKVYQIADNTEYGLADPRSDGVLWSR